MFGVRNTGGKPGYEIIERKRVIVCAEQRLDHESDSSSAVSSSDAVEYDGIGLAVENDAEYLPFFLKEFLINESAVSALQRNVDPIHLRPERRAGHAEHFVGTAQVDVGLESVERMQTNTLRFRKCLFTRRVT